MLVERLTERGRADDGEATVRHRLLSHEEETAPMIAALRSQGTLAIVDGSQGVCDVLEAIVRQLAHAGWSRLATTCETPPPSDRRAPEAAVAPQGLHAGPLCRRSA